MRFRQNHDAEDVYQRLLPGRPGMRVYTCRAGDWQFVITFDLLHSLWCATYKAIHNASPQAIPVDNAPPGKEMMDYPSQRDAEKACERKYKQLRAKS